MRRQRQVARPAAAVEDLDRAAEVASPASSRTCRRCLRNSLIWVNFARIVGRTRPSAVAMPITSSRRSARPSGSGTSFTRLCGDRPPGRRPGLPRPTRTLPFFVVRTSISSASVVTWTPAKPTRRAPRRAAGRLGVVKFFVVADVRHAGHEQHRPLQAQAEAGVRHRAVPPQVEVPPVGLRVEALLAHPLFQHVEPLLALAAADDLADAGTSTSIARTVLPSSFTRM